ncbi:DUF2158 domain-containing protein [Corallococcus macrosporus]|uniref:DUF2158 domain-containing protein n=1 Tax=Corallococcus macrosporus TaxID=35 RepID=A0ABS3DIR1_9BACT|nr:DUF2158 domain-containing protein [Corallococcus macrosporus]MBN8231199.1 DUF2158 domain-containing protein [Corallococcus macrosporus]
MKRFQIGDIVKLKTGGPAMTVQALTPGGPRCQWFAGRKLEQSVFPSASLEPTSVKPQIPDPGSGGAGS